MNRGLLAAASLMLVSVGGCAGGLDRDQMRACRLALVALAPPGAAVTILAQHETNPSAADLDASETPLAGATALQVDARLSRPDGATADTFIDCTFGIGPNRLRPVAIRTPAGLLSLPRLFALDRFWLDTIESTRADPQPLAGVDLAPRIPVATGYALQQAINAIPGSAVYALMAAAYALIYGLVGRINLAFGAFCAIGGTAAVTAVLALADAPIAVALGLVAVAALVPAACYGIASSRLVFRPLRAATGQQVLVATIGLALVLAEYLRLTQGSQPRWIGPMLDAPFALAQEPDFIVTITPIAVIVSLLAAAVVASLLVTMRYTSFGRQWRAFRDDPGAAALFGVGLDQIFARSFALAAGLAGLAGGITVVVYGDISFAYAQIIGLKALTAAILGGIGSVSGAVLGGLFIGLVEAGWSAAFPIVDRDLVVFAILIATLIWRPGGFLGDRDLTPRRV
jgi:branched-subunit amino acid ABC-type transport system permease component